MTIPNTTVTVSFWPHFADPILARLTADDDPRLWQAAIERVIGDAELACRDNGGKTRIIAQIGCCSHWLGPNKARWLTPDGEFTWPSGYHPKGGFFGGLPEFDWHLFWERNEKGVIWRQVAKVRAKRPLLLRVAVPARTGLHLRASIQAIWIGGPRPDLNQSRWFYGFRKIDNLWQCKAFHEIKTRSRR